MLIVRFSGCEKQMRTVDLFHSHNIGYCWIGAVVLSPAASSLAWWGC